MSICAAAGRRSSRRAAAAVLGRGRVAAAGLRTVRLLAIGDPVSGAADVAVHGRRAAPRARCSDSAFGVGYFGVGASWLYISIHEHGAALDRHFPRSPSDWSCCTWPRYHALLGWGVARAPAGARRVALVRGAAGILAADRVVPRLDVCADSRGCRSAIRRPTPCWRATRRCSASTACRRCCCCSPARCSPAWRHAAAR